mgnify:CR=1 FL=1|tara:strand:- start:15 stop:317 length:303 start_codon:yes stop_codon:yes gene_type:complete
MILETYQKALQNLYKKIPDNYEKKDILTEKIANTIEHLYHKAPEIISIEFSQRCSQLIQYLPKRENGITKPGNEWADEGWKFITDAAKKVNIHLREKGYS